MATDYDAPRRRVDDDLETDSLEGLRAAEVSTGVMDDDDGEIVEPIDLAPQDLSGEDIDVTVIPRRADEFTCSSCFLVQRRSRIDHVEEDGSAICRDCA